MEKRMVTSGNPETPLAPEIENGSGEQRGEKSPEQDHDVVPEKAKEEIDIKQVPVDGICGGY
jgi:hypothetical protein